MYLFSHLETGRSEVNSSVFWAITPLNKPEDWKINLNRGASLKWLTVWRYLNISLVPWLLCQFRVPHSIDDDNNTNLYSRRKAQAGTCLILCAPHCALGQTCFLTEINKCKITTIFNYTNFVLRRHVSATLVTIYRLSYSNNTRQYATEYVKCVRKIC